MTLTTFVRKNAFRNLRRSILTVLSIGFSLLLLTLMMAIWRNFYLQKGTEVSALRLVTRHKVSLAFEMPSYYREKIRAIPGVANVVPGNWFGGKYKDDKSNNFFAQFGTDPDEFFQVYKDWKIPDDQIAAWQHDRAGCVVDTHVAQKFGWKLGQKIIIVGTIFPVNLELNIRGFYTAPEDTSSLYYNQKYVEESVPYLKGVNGFYTILAKSPQDVPKIQAAVDETFHSSPQPTKTETEKAFQLGFLAMLGNVKAFILSICGAVVFAILLVSANTMAMSIRERTREVAVLKTLGFTRQTVLKLFVGEAVVLALIGGIAGSLVALLLSVGAAKAGGMAGALKVAPATMLVAWGAAAVMGFFSALVPAYHASRLGIVEGLRHIG
ncbi:MAG TPA: FtsX-like permease family protein [Terriglobales bacterium]|nr:FtsX-like permease family protein [Terriglobales bacterium]